MLEHIINSYDKFLKTTKDNLFTFFSNEKEDEPQLNKRDRELIAIDKEIAHCESNLESKKDIHQKLEIRARLLRLYLKRKSIQYSNGYIKISQNIIIDEVEDSLYEALDYLKRVPKNLDKQKQKEILLYKALIYELLEDFDMATRCYKRAISYDKTVESLRDYKNFVERSRETLEWYKNNKHAIKFNSLNLHNLVALEDIPEVIKRLDSLAKYYARSPKSRELGKKYFKEVIKLHRKLYESNKRRNACAYIDALIDGVEIFMMSPTILKEAYDMLMNDRDCIESRVYLLEKINNLKSKGFIKHSGVFN